MYVIPAKVEVPERALSEFLGTDFISLLTQEFEVYSRLCGGGIAKESSFDEYTIEIEVDGVLSNWFYGYIGSNLKGGFDIILSSQRDPRHLLLHVHSSDGHVAVNIPQLVATNGKVSQIGVEICQAMAALLPESCKQCQR